MPRLMFNVLHPAMQPLMGSMPPMPDSQLVYSGSSAGTDALPPTIGGAIVMGGSRVGDKWFGCTYIKPPFVIPGFGTIEMLK